MSDGARILYVAHGDVGETIEAAVGRVCGESVEATDGTDAIKRLEYEAVDAVVVPAALPDVPVDAVLRRASGAAGPPIVVGDAAGARGPMIQLPADVTVESLADRIDRALRDRRLGAALDRQDRLEDAFRRIATAVAGAADRRAVERAIHEGLAETGAYRVVWVGLREDDAVEFVAPVHHRVAVEDVGALLGADATAVREAIESGTVTQHRAAADVSTGADVESVLTAVPLVDGDRTRGVVVLATDPTDAPDHAERALLERVGRVGGAALSTGGSGTTDGTEALLRVLAHELRNPLNVATLSLEAARRDGDDADLERAETALETMASVVDATTAMARGHVRERESTDLHEVAVSVWRTVREPPAELTIVEPATVEADPALLERLLSNLFSNAVEHAGPSVSVRIGTLPGGRGFFVEDDGPGIPSRDRERAFEWGYTTDVDGTGVGLGLVREVAEAHGWAVSVTEGEEGGARFEVETAREDDPASLFGEPSGEFEFPHAG